MVEKAEINTIDMAESTRDEVTQHQVGEKQTLFQELKEVFPNLRRGHTFAEAKSGDYKLTDEMLQTKFDDLTALAELYEFTDKVFALDVQGSLPVMYIDMGPKYEDDPDGGRKLEKIYAAKHPSGGGKYSLHIWGEGWDPKILNDEMETEWDGIGYTILTTPTKGN